MWCLQFLGLWIPVAVCTQPEYLVEALIGYTWESSDLVVVFTLWWDNVRPFLKASLLPSHHSWGSYWVKAFYCGEIRFLLKKKKSSSWWFTAMKTSSCVPRKSWFIETISSEIKPFIQFTWAVKKLSDNFFFFGGCYLKLAMNDHVRELLFLLLVSKLYSYFLNHSACSLFSVLVSYKFSILVFRLKSHLKYSLFLILRIRNI